jgi:hypothetical protein
VNCDLGQYRQGTNGCHNSINTADLATHVAAMKAAAAEAAAIQAFETLCVAFETAHGILPVDRAIRTVRGWSKPTYNGVPKPGRQAIRFEYDGVRAEFKLV